MDDSTTRRGLLAATGAALTAGLAGCSGVEGSNETETIPGHRLPDPTDDGEAEPVVVEALPLSIEPAALAARAERTRALLATLPIPLTSTHVPNGYVRERLLEESENAREHLEAARNAGSRFAALKRLRDARAAARFAAAGWAYAQGEVTEADLRAEHQQALDDAASLRDDHEYRGDDPVRAARIHAVVERNLAFVAERRDRSYWSDETMLSAAELGEHAEYARATVADSGYLYERFLDSLPEDAGNVEGRLETAAERVADDLEARRGELEPLPDDANERRFYHFRHDLRSAVEYAPSRVADAPGAGSAVLNAMSGLVHGMAYDRVVERLESEEGVQLSTAADVRRERQRAVEALESALEEGPNPVLVRPPLAAAAWRVAWADEELARYRGEIRVARLTEPVGRYVAATARARSAEPACERVLEALED